MFIYTVVSGTNMPKENLVLRLCIQIVPKGPGLSNRPDSDEAHQYHHYALTQHGNETGVGPSWAESAQHQLAPSGERPTWQRINHARTPGISNSQ